MRRGEVGKSLARADLSLAPTRLTFASGISRDESNSTAFLFPVERSDDNRSPPTLALNHLWRNSAGLTWQPLGMLNLSSDLISTRDLRIYPDSSPLGRLAFSERRFLLGLPVGVERDRTLSHGAPAHAQAGVVAPSAAFCEQQLRAQPDALEPGSGAGGR